MSRTLVLMRHAKSSWDIDTTDDRRELSPRGTRDARKAGQELAAAEIRPDLAVISPTARTRLTWQGVAESFGTVPSEELATLYGHDPEEIVARLRDLPADAQTVIVVGHAPTTAEVVELVARREPTRAWYGIDEKFPTAAYAVIDLDGEWTDLGHTPGRLVYFVIPRG